MLLSDQNQTETQYLLETFDAEKEVEYDGDRYVVRDNGAVFRRNQYRRRARPLDNTWTFGRQNKTTGYMHVAGVPVHRIVCSAFAGLPASRGHVVDHIDTNRANNRPENLRWVTRLENVLLNPISARRIELVYGSIEAFFSNPHLTKSDAVFPDITWMRSVSKEEAAAARERLMAWANGGSVPSGGALGEWLYGTPEKADFEPEPEEFESLTPSAVQVRWRVPTEFPLCPDSVSETALDEYASRLSFGSVFSKNAYNTSLVVEHTATEDGLVVLTRFASESVKDWAVAHVAIVGEFFYHRSERTFFGLQGALKHFCELSGQSYEESIDDYC